MKLSVSIGLLSISLVLLPIISLAEITAADAINSMIRDRELEWEEAEKICFNSTEDEPLKVSGPAGACLSTKKRTQV